MFITGIQLFKIPLRREIDNATFYFLIFLVKIQSIYWSVFSPNTRKYGPENTPYLDTFHAVFTSCNNRLLNMAVW